MTDEECIELTLMQEFRIHYATDIAQVTVSRSINALGVTLQTLHTLCERTRHFNCLKIELEVFYEAVLTLNAATQIAYENSNSIGVAQNEKLIFILKKMKWFEDALKQSIPLTDLYKKYSNCTEEALKGDTNIFVSLSVIFFILIIFLASRTTFRR